MIRELLKKLQAILRSMSMGNGKPKPLDPLEILKAGYYDLCRLAGQIHSHADRAPYSHVAQRLRQMAVEKKANANALREKMVSLGGRLVEPQLELNSGKNHWERMVRDLADQRTLESSLLEQAILLAEVAPEISDLLRETANAQTPHREILLDLVARADPQADQS